MDSEIEFGDVEEVKREVQLRPDQNRHYSVVPVHSPENEDIPIYVDIDAMRDMESHALTDTTVELGGVMLGGQYEDESGNPFVVVTDSLRAEHYEATKGSFKFTHETWQQISRQRDEFPPDLQMVGWYHTHPDWGVFLSGMDMFICDNFFNRPLDLALVIDPCRGDRGWFHWITNSDDRIRRTGGFHLIGSRFRLAEMEYFAYQLRGKLNMSSDYRSPGVAGSIGPSPAPVVNITESRSAASSLGLVGILAMQFLFLAVITWKLLFPAAEDDSVAKIKKEFSAFSAEKLNEEKIKILNQALAMSGDKAELAKLLADNKDLEIRLEDSTAKRQQLASDNRSLNAAVRIAKTKREDLEKRSVKQKKLVSELRTEVKELKEAAEEGEKPFWQNGQLLLLGVSLTAIAAIGGTAFGFLLGRLRGEDVDSDADYEPFEIRDEKIKEAKELDPNDESDNSNKSELDLDERD